MDLSGRYYCLVMLTPWTASASRHGGTATRRRPTFPTASRDDPYGAAAPTSALRAHCESRLSPVGCPACESYTRTSHVMPSGCSCLSLHGSDQFYAASACSLAPARVIKGLAQPWWSIKVSLPSQSLLSSSFFFKGGAQAVTTSTTALPDPSRCPSRHRFGHTGLSCAGYGRVGPIFD